ncbi:helix-turn-helix domain-containing protein [Streptomyces mirabilis]|uniref:helix-turn-helix domain-containing protein n=1 Tax=Streptomyces mirabilis TaxID=68239 RepID=UPI00365EE727
MLKVRRVAARLSQSQLAREAKVDRSFLNKTECGRVQSPSLRYVATLAAALDCSVDELMDDDTVPTELPCAIGPEA